MDHEATCLSDSLPPFKRDNNGQLLGRVDMHMPLATKAAIETAALHAHRTWDEQLAYMFGVCLRDHVPDKEDQRTRDEWMALYRSIEFLTED